MTRRRFITFEGGEGSGKSTQAARLAQRLRDRAFDVIATREPGGSPFGERLRGALLAPIEPAPDALTLALTFNANRADHLARTIRPALAAGAFVICDRFADSTRVYQGVAGDLDLETLDWLDERVLGETVPELTFVIDIDPEIGLRRAAERAAVARHGHEATTPADMFESRDVAYHRSLRDGFLEVARAAPRRCVVLDGTHSADELAVQVWRAVVERFVLEDAG